MQRPPAVLLALALADPTAETERILAPDPADDDVFREVGTPEERLHDTALDVREYEIARREGIDEGIARSDPDHLGPPVPLDVRPGRGDRLRIQIPRLHRTVSPPGGEEGEESAPAPEVEDGPGRS